MSQAPENWEEYQEYLERARRHFKELENGSTDFSFQQKRTLFSSIKEHQGMVTFLIIVILLVNLFVVIPIFTRQIDNSSSDEGTLTPKLPENNNSKEHLPTWKTLFRVSNSMVTFPHYILDNTLNKSKPLPLADVPHAAWLLINEELFIERGIDNYTSLALLTSYLERHELTWEDLNVPELSNTTIAVLSNMSTEELSWIAFTINSLLVRRNMDNITVTFNHGNSSTTSTISLTRTLNNLLNQIQGSRILPNLTFALDYPLSSQIRSTSTVLRARTQLLLAWLLLDTSRAMDYVNFNPLAEELFEAFIQHFFIMLGPQNNYKAVISELQLVNASEITTRSSNDSLVMDQLLAYYLSDRFWKITDKDTYLKHRVQAGDFLLNEFITENYSVMSRINLDSMAPLSSTFITNDHLWAVIFYFLTGQYGIADNILTNLVKHSYNSTIGLIKSCFLCDESSYVLFDQILLKFTDNTNASFLITPTVAESNYIPVITETTQLAQETYLAGGAIGIDVPSGVLITIAALIMALAVGNRKKKCRKRKK